MSSVAHRSLSWWDPLGSALLCGLPLIPAQRRPGPSDRLGGFGCGAALGSFVSGDGEIVSHDLWVHRGPAEPGALHAGNGDDA